ncbi:SRPBCC family protein [Amycolatopsis acididurans]|nr:SRPBCC family protein [Amycolatopsis acididurans]
MDIAAEINAIRRRVHGRAVVACRTYDAAPGDVWQACTDPGRLARWFLPVTGDLRPGGSYQLQGNAGGEIVRCEPPEVLRVTWIFGEGPASVVEVRLRPGAEGTLLELEHSDLADHQHWDQFGPGAVGVGWDMTLLGLALHVSGHGNPADWGSSGEAREFMTESARAWGVAHVVSGEDPAQAVAAAQRTQAVYVRPQD